MALDEAIGKYYRKLKDKARHMMAVFTPLDAQENAFAGNDNETFYSPEAVELFEDEDDWLHDKIRDEYNGGFLSEEDDLGEVEPTQEDEADDCNRDEMVRDVRRGDLLGILEEEPRVIVSGEPGGGKTTCLLYYSLQRESAVLELGRELVLFIPMGQWWRGGSLEAMMMKTSGLCADQLSQLIVQHRLRLVIDAVNECPDAFRSAAILNIDKYLKSHDDLPAVISTRHPEELSDLRLPTFGVQPMDDEHRRHYLERYIGDAEQAAHLLSQIMALPGGETIAENPMLLRLVVEVYKASPCRNLPNGRAGLYRRSLHYWYKREREKARKSGQRILWTEEETIGLLAEIAYRSRVKGYRDIPVEFIREVWAADSDCILQGLCQGPVVYLDAEFLRFRHETFQEYLCAEFLVRHSEKIHECTVADYAQWGMPFAYAIELFESAGQILPENLWLAAWAFNPWIGVAITGKDVGEQLMRGCYQGSYPKISGRPLGSKHEGKRTGIVYLDAIIARFDANVLFLALDVVHGCWYKKSDAVLRYVIAVSKFGLERWKALELALLPHLHRLRVQQALTLAENLLTLKNPRGKFQYHAAEKWDQWVSAASPGLAVKLIDSNIAIASDFDEVKKEWFRDLKLRHAIPLAQHRLLDSNDVACFLPQWIDHASVTHAAAMLQLGWCQRTAFSDRAKQWVGTANVATLICIVQHGFAAGEVVQRRINEILPEAEPKDIALLINSGIVGLELCQERISAIKEIASPAMSIQLVRWGLAQPEELRSFVPEWVKFASPSILVMLVQYGLAIIGEIEGRRLSLISAASPRDACTLIKNKLASVPEFYGRIRDWANCDSYGDIACFVSDYGDAEIRRLINPAVKRWILNASAKTATYLVRDGLAGRCDFSKRLPWWKNIGDIYEWKSFLDCGLVSAGEYHRHRSIVSTIQYACKAIGADPSQKNLYSKQLECWIKYAPLSCIPDLIRAGVAAREDFGSRIAKWIEGDVGDCKIERVCTLMMRGIVVRETARAAVLPLLSTCGFSDVMRLRQANIISFCDLKERCGSRFVEWVRNATPNQIRWLIKWKLVEMYADRNLMLLLREKLTPLDCMMLIQDGSFQREDIAGNSLLEYFHDKRLVCGMIKTLGTQHAHVDVSGVEGRLARKEFEFYKLRIGEKYDFIAWVKRGENFIRLSYAFANCSFKEGDVCFGQVKSIIDSGVIVAFPSGVDGFLCNSNLSWTKRNPCAQEMLAVGDEIRVVVLAVNIEKRRISLGIKQLQPNPWDKVIQMYSVGQSIEGLVTKVVQYGIFVEIASGVEGLVHVSELDWMRKITNAKDSGVANPGDKLRVKIIGIDQPNKKIALSVRQLTSDPWDAVQDRFPVGAKMMARVCKFVDYGAFVELAGGFNGLVHINDMSWTQKISHPSECLRLGQEIEVVVLGVQLNEHRISLGIKQAQKDLRPEVFLKYPIGTVIKGKVSQLASFGAFVELEERVDGLVHISQMSDRQVENVKDVLSVGQEITARVVKVEKEIFRIGLSTRALSMTDEQFGDYMRNFC